MTSEKTPTPLAQAEELAAEVVELFAPFCEIIEVLGSIRRRKPFVGDIEIGVLPKFVDGPTDIFGDVAYKVNAQLQECQRLRAAGVLATRPNKNDVSTCGPGTQFLLYKGFALDVFGAASRDAWGVTKIIRTGSGDFNKRLVRQKAEGGTILPLGMRFDGGRLLDRGVAVSTPEEEDVFEAIGLSFIRPEDRL